jgi:hypothetical protein
MERAQKLELFEHNLDYGSKGPLDNLLNDLDRVETRFKSDYERERDEAGYSENDPVSRARKFIYAANKQRQENQQQDENEQQASEENEHQNEESQQAAEDTTEAKSANVEAMENVTDYLPQHEPGHEEPDSGGDEGSDKQQDGQQQQNPVKNDAQEQSQSETAEVTEDTGQVSTEPTAEQVQELAQAVEKAEQETAAATEQVDKVISAAEDQAQASNSSVLENFVKSEDQQNEYMESKDEDDEDSLSLDDLIAQLDLTERDFNLRTQVENKIHNKLGDAASAADEFLHEGHTDPDNVNYHDSSESIESAEEAL